MEVINKGKQDHPLEDTKVLAQVYLDVWLNKVKDFSPSKTNRRRSLSR
jgi:hypothetical protein